MLIIGIGNAYRTDDGVGLVVARQIRAWGVPDAVVLELTGEGAALMDAWREASAVILIDAASSGAPPGTIHRLDASAQDIPARFFSSSTHDFGLAEAVAMARALGELPPRLIIYGIEGKDFAFGSDLSPEVEAAAAIVADRVIQDLKIR